MSDTVYLGNPNLKKANVKVEFTQENIEEFINCLLYTSDAADE